MVRSADKTVNQADRQTDRQTDRHVKINMPHPHFVCVWGDLGVGAGERHVYIMPHLILHVHDVVVNLDQRKYAMTI